MAKKDKNKKQKKPAKAKPVQQGKVAGKGTPSTQRYLRIAEVRDDVTVLRDGTLRAVLLCSSINFSLKSEDEQNAIISAYVSFLNALDFPVQIVIQSRKLDMEGYLEQLHAIEREQPNELLRLQIADYRTYVGELIQIGEIMTKRFYVVVPYDPLSNRKEGFWSRLGQVFSAASAVKLSQAKFAKRRAELEQRIGHVIGSLGSMGVKAVQLDTQSLIELYYSTYNPEVASHEKLVNLDELRVRRSAG